ncbi:LysE family transporter [Moraxella bovoculi]|nr:LysE family transporter [Moraxella bovoculi]
MRQHVFWVCLICLLCDFILMSMGMLGLGSLISQSHIATLMLPLGAAFLFWYGFRAFKSAHQGTSALALDDQRQTHALGKTIATTHALTLLTPHVYLNTFFLVGSIASPLSLGDKYYFLIGAVLASATWFFGLGYGARLLTPLFKKFATWRVLDTFIGIVMWAIAFSLVRHALTLAT